MGERLSPGTLVRTILGVIAFGVLIYGLTFPTKNFEHEACFVKKNSLQCFRAVARMAWATADQDVARAFDYGKEGCRQGENRACAEVAAMHARGGDWPQAFSYAVRSCATGDEAGCCTFNALRAWISLSPTNTLYESALRAAEKHPCSETRAYVLGRNEALVYTRSMRTEDFPKAPLTLSSLKE